MSRQAAAISPSPAAALPAGAPSVDRLRGALGMACELDIERFPSATF
jgi:hypothetical protein